MQLPVRPRLAPLRPLTRLRPLALLPLLALPTLLAALPSVSRAEEKVEKTAADLLPGTTVIYAELARPKAVLDTVLDHPLRQKLESLDQYQQAMETPEYLRFKAGVAVIEAELAMPWRKILESATTGGVYLGVDSASQGLAVLLKARDETTLTKIVDTLTRLARDEAQRNGQADPIKTGEYRGVKAFRAGDSRVALLGSWLLATNKDQLGQRIIDNFVDGSPEVLSSREGFRKAREESKQEESAQAVSGEGEGKGEGKAGWAFFDLEAIRTLDQEDKLFRDTRDNPVGELLVGGIFAVLKQSPYATLSLNVNPQQAQFTASLPYQPKWVGESRHYYFGADGRAAAPPLLKVDGQMLSISTYRDLSELWLRADDLFDQQVNDGLAQADSNLSTLFSGKDFGEDILGAFGPELQLIVARQVFGDKRPQPATKLPAFALAAKLKNPEVMQPELRRIFMSLVGFLNVVGAMNGQPQLDFDLEKEGDRQLVAARYVPSVDEQQSKEARINFNFSPTVGFRGATFVVASTRQLAADLLDATAKNTASAVGDTAVHVNSTLRADLQVARDALADNRNQLIAQNMLEEGHTREEAEVQIGLLLELLGLLRSAELRLESTDQNLQLNAQLDLAP